MPSPALAAQWRTKRGLPEQGRRGFPAEGEGLAAEPFPCTLELSSSPPSQVVGRSPVIQRLAGEVLNLGAGSGTPAGGGPWRGVVSPRTGGRVRRSPASSVPCVLPYAPPAEVARGPQSKEAQQVGAPTPAEGTGALCSIVGVPPIKDFPSKHLAKGEAVALLHHGVDGGHECGVSVHGASGAVVAWDLADDGLREGGVVAVSQARVPVVVPTPRLGWGEVCVSRAVEVEDGVAVAQQDVSGRGADAVLADVLAGGIIEGGVIVHGANVLLGSGRVVGLALGSG